MPKRLIAHLQSGNPENTAPGLMPREERMNPTERQGCNAAIPCALRCSPARLSLGFPSANTAVLSADYALYPCSGMVISPAMDFFIYSLTVSASLNLA